jgi:hypothetical protein
VATKRTKKSQMVHQCLKVKGKFGSINKPPEWLRRQSQGART